MKIVNYATVATEMGRGGVSMVVAAAFTNSTGGLFTWYVLMTWNPDEDGGASSVVK